MCCVCFVFGNGRACVRRRGVASVGRSSGGDATNERGSAGAWATAGGGGAGGGGANGRGGLEREVGRAGCCCLLLRLLGLPGRQGTSTRARADDAARQRARLSAPRSRGERESPPFMAPSPLLSLRSLFPLLLLLLLKGAKSHGSGGGAIGAPWREPSARARRAQPPASRRGEGGRGKTHLSFFLLMRSHAPRPFKGGR